jgi:hypothetical protein
MRLDDPRPPAYLRLEQAVGGRLAQFLVGALASPSDRVEGGSSRPAG